MDPARLAAFDLLRAVHEDGAYANLALPRMLREREIAGRDAAFATELAFGTLRLRGRYDAVLGLCSSRPVADIDPRPLDALRLGAHQILGMAVPDYAAVSAGVALVRMTSGAGPASFANAVLRRVCERGWPDWEPLLPPDPAEDPLGHLAVAESHPRWIASALRESLASVGREAELSDLLRVQNTPAPVTLVARPGRSQAAELSGRPGRWSPWAVRADGDPAALAEVRDGRAAVQDEGSQLALQALVAAPAPEGPWLDMCAGPGGKTADLAGIAVQRQVPLSAIELHPHRADLVRRAVAGMPVTVRTGDATVLAEPSTYARVLLDAPCTGIGAVRRRPDLRWRRERDDIPPLRAVQAALLDAALRSVVPGGIVAYVTCSPHLAETDGIVSAALRRHPAVRQVDAREFLPEVPDLGPGPAVRLWPHVHDTDGMYVEMLVRD